MALAKLQRYHWRHFFGGIALVLLIVQFLSGVVLTMYYAPHLREAYASIQHIYNEIGTAAWIRDTHRWVALFLMLAVILHFLRSFLRRDYLNRREKTFWLTGMLLFLPLLGFLITGFVLPWEWRAYWFMEMVPNYVEGIAGIGPWLADYLVDAFSISRNFAAHVIILPVITLVLMELHSLIRIRNRKGGISRYLGGHSLITLPFLLVIFALAYVLPMPTQDPDIIPMPLEGTYIPAPEWFVLLLFEPYIHFEGFMAVFWSFYFPLALFLVLTLFPYYLEAKNSGKAGSRKGQGSEASSKEILRRIIEIGTLQKTLGGVSVVVVALILFGSLYTVSYKSPTMGCNSCHNVYSGLRMGVPPETYKQRETMPLLSDTEWMMRHWYYPQVVW